MMLDGANIVYSEHVDSDGRTIFVGVGDHAGLRGTSLFLTQKNRSNYRAAVESVTLATTADLEAWRNALGLEGQVQQPFNGIRIVIEDASPDTCLTLVALAHRLNGRELPLEWIDYAARWELGYVDTTGPAETSWGALHSALVHAELDDLDLSASISRAVRMGVDYITSLLQAHVTPANVPRVLPAGSPPRSHELHRFAHSRLEYEHLVYRRAVESSLRAQLAVPIVGTKRSKLVDAIFMTEVRYAGAVKVWLRRDTSTWTGTGFEVIGLFRPQAAGTGNDMSISVDPGSGILLRDLWRELERREDAAWTTAHGIDPALNPERPRDQPRVLASFKQPVVGLSASNQPWWDDNGNYTLVAAPRSLSQGGKPGTKLTWLDVLDATWSCYAPAMGINVRPRRTSDSPRKLTEPAPSGSGFRTALANCSDLVIADLVRVSQPYEEPVLWSPTLTASCAAFVQTGVPRIDKLPSPETFDVIATPGGMVMITFNGLMIVELVPDSGFLAAEIRRTAEELGRTYGALRDLEARLKEAGAAANAAVEKGGSKDKRAALDRIYKLQMRAREVWGDAMHVETDPLIRRVRAAMERRWGTATRFERIMAEVKDIEAMVLTVSEVRANDMIDKITVYGFPALVCGGILGVALAPLGNSKAKALEHGHIAWRALLAFVILAAALAGALALWRRITWQSFRR